MTCGRSADDGPTIQMTDAKISSFRGGIVIKSEATVYGTFLAPDRGTAVDHGNVYGAVSGRHADSPCFA